MDVRALAHARGRHRPFYQRPTANRVVPDSTQKPEIQGAKFKMQTGFGSFLHFAFREGLRDRLARDNGGPRMARSVWHHQKPLAWLSALVVVTFVVSAGTHAQTQLQPHQILVFISAVDAAGAPVTDLKPDEIAM